MSLQTIKELVNTLKQELSKGDDYTKADQNILDIVSNIEEQIQKTETPICGWESSDVRQAIENSEDGDQLTEEQKDELVNDVLYKMQEDFDASVGMNWEIIDGIVIDEIKKYLDEENE